MIGDKTRGLPGHVLLVRGINVGGRNRFPVKQLAAALERAGCSCVRTYIQSGNAVFRATPAIARTGAAGVAAALEREIGHQVPVLLRTAGELAEIVRGNPFRDAERLPQTLHVGFMAVQVPGGLIADLDPNRSPPDEFAVRGREIYLRLPNGVARTKFTNSYFDRVLQTPTTFRNWRTVRKLAEMAQE